jgi:hypothetical protein
MCNERAAPAFDSSKPRELSQYFEDLEQLIKHASIRNQQDMKKQVLCYVDFSTKQIWKTFPEFLDDNKTYKNFKCYDFEQCVWVKPVLVFGTEQNSIVNSRGLGSKRSQGSSQVSVWWASQRVPLWSGIVLESLRTIYQADQTKF